MAKMYVAIEPFSLRSTWQNVWDDKYYLKSTKPSTAKMPVSFKVSGLPDGATVNSAILRTKDTQTKGGGSFKIDGNGSTAQIDVTGKINKNADGSFNDLVLTYEFTAYGDSGASAPKGTRSTFCNIKESTIEIDYTATGDAPSFDADAYRAAALAPARRIQPRGVITYADGAKQPFSWENIIGFEINEGLNSGVLLGTATSSMLEMRLANANGEWYMGGGMRGNRPLIGARLSMEIGLSVDVGNNIFPYSQKEYHAKQGVGNKCVIIPVRDIFASHVGEKVSLSYSCYTNSDFEMRVYAYQRSGISIAEEKRIECKNGINKFTFDFTIKDFNPKEKNSSGEIIFVDFAENDFTISKINLRLHVAPKTVYSPAGTFVIEEVTGNEGEPSIYVSGFDDMANKLQEKFDDDGVYPASLNDILNRIVAKSGMSLRGVLAANRTVMIPAKPDWGKECTLRQALAFVCGAGASFASVSRDGYIEVSPTWNDKVSLNLDPETYLTAAHDERKFAFNRLVVKPRKGKDKKDNISAAINGGVEELPSNTLYIDDNPLFVKGQAIAQTMADGVKTALNGAVWEGTNIRWRGDPTVTVGTRFDCALSSGAHKISTIMGQSIEWEQGFRMGALCGIETREMTTGAITGGGMIDSKKIAVEAITTPMIGNGAITGVKIENGAVVADKIDTGAITTDKLDAKAVTAEKIDAKAVTAEKIDAKAITAEKIDTGAVTTDKLDAKAITAEKIDTGAVTTDKLDAKSVTAEKIAAGAIDADKISAGAITAEKIDAGAITTDKLDAGAVTADKIGAGAITAGKIAGKSITADKMVAGTITAESGIIAQSAIGTTQIADGSITDAKIVGLTANKITAGTINGKVVNVNNLNADNITTGTINGKRIPTLGTDKLEDGAVTKDKVGKDAITADKIVAGAVTAGKLAANSVIANNIVSGAITTDKIEANAITTDKIKAESVTTKKLASDVGQSLDLSSNKSVNILVNDIQVGGINLLPWTKSLPGFFNANERYKGFNVIYNSLANETRADYADVYIKQVFDLSEAEYAFSFYARADSPVAVSVYLWNENLLPVISSVTSQGKTGGGSTQIPVDVSTSWERYWVKWTKAPDNAERRVIVRIQAGSTSETNKVYLCAPKLETGNKVTDWSPSPDDADARISAAEAEIIVHTDQIKERVTKKDSDAKFESERKQTAAEINASVSAIQIGGSNILPDSERERTTNRFLEIPVREIFKDHVGEHICISFEAKSTLGREIRMYPYQSSGISINSRNADGNLYLFTPPTDKFQRFTFLSGIVNYGDIPDRSKGSIAFYDDKGDQNYTIRRIKIEFGNKPTSWSPYSGDPAQTLKNSKVSIGLEGIDMSSTGHINATAGGSIRLKAFGGNGDDSSIDFPNFKLASDGEIDAGTINAQSVKIRGHEVFTDVKFIRSATQPKNVHDVYWIKPNATTSKNYSYTSGNDDNIAKTGGNDFSLASPDTSPLPSASGYKYKFVCTVNEYAKNRGNTKFNVKLISGGNIIDLGTQTVWIKQWTTKTLTFESGVIAQNLTTSPITFRITSTDENGSSLNSSKGLRLNPETMQTLTVTANVGSGVTPCELFYID